MAVEIVVMRESETRCLSLKYRFVQTAFGEMLIASSGFGVCALWFADSHDKALYHLSERFGDVVISEGRDEFQTRVLDCLEGKTTDICLHLKGTPFQLKVWNVLLNIPRGKVSTYREIAEHIGHSRAYRAVGSAVGANPVAIVIPCHRVLPANGGIGNYKWGINRKARLLDIERVGNL